MILTSIVDRKMLENLRADLTRETDTEKRAALKRLIAKYEGRIAG